MLSRYVLAFLLASAAPALAGERLVAGATTVSEVEAALGAPADTIMAPDGSLTLVYDYGRVSGQLPAAFAVVRGSDADARLVALRFGADFRFRKAAVTGLTADSAGELARVSLAADVK